MGSAPELAIETTDLRKYFGETKAVDFQGEPGAGMFTELWPLDSWPDIPTTVLAPREDWLFPIEAPSPG
ncbi:MAG: hypothetical protein ACR2K6_09465 [Solirubrobacterales bacterium]|jgi:hypothetical protein